MTIQNPVRPGLAVAPMTYLRGIPLRNPGSTIAAHQNDAGDLSVVLRPSLVPTADGGHAYGYPYGVVPRLFLVFLATAAYQEGSRRLEIGELEQRFMSFAGLEYSGRDKARVSDQIRRLLGSAFVFKQRVSEHTGEVTVTRHTRIAEEWDSRTGLVVLSDEFFDDATDDPTLIDANALRVLRSSPFDIDVYLWLASIAPDEQATFSWAEIRELLPDAGDEPRRFRARLLDAISRGLDADSRINATATATGVTLNG